MLIKYSILTRESNFPAIPSFIQFVYSYEFYNFDDQVFNIFQHTFLVRFVTPFTCFSWALNTIQEFLALMSNRHM